MCGEMHVSLGDCTDTEHQSSPENLLHYVTDCSSSGGAGLRSYLLELNPETCWMTAYGDISAWATGLVGGQYTLLLALRVGWEPHNKIQCLQHSRLNPAQWFITLAAR